MSIDLGVYELGMLWIRYSYARTDITPQVIVNEENARDTGEFIQKRLSAIKNQRSTGELEDLALIIGQHYAQTHRPFQLNPHPRPPLQTAKA